MLIAVSLPAACLTDIWLARGGGLVLGNPYGDCWPGTRDLSTTVSPATCPSGYTSVYDATPTRDSLEIVWACCPSGYRTDGGVYSCTSDATNTIWEAKTYDGEGSERTFDQSGIPFIRLRSNDDRFDLDLQRHIKSHVIAIPDCTKSNPNHNYTDTYTHEQ
ncbi:hypothetical protein F5Y18DRAFT_422886 [Xylariaceae sp. FL1019]|nr:hypothetical protein F5Y18DRAFT_422886 [Xylariaceae sp. FL1019]